jgi:threonine aldolase
MTSTPPLLSDPALRAQCTRFLSGNPPRSQRAWLELMSSSPLLDLAIDQYNTGPAITQLEQEVATLLGKPAALFVHKGVVAQQIALRIWADRSGRRAIALHPKSHIAFDEDNAYQRISGLLGLPIGRDNAPFTLADLTTIREPLAAVTIELPLRQAGFKLPSWAELNALAAWAKTQGIPLHIDGARLWECAPYYEHTLAEIAALADSVYVSFYKGLGGIGGCALAGSEEFIATARSMLTRYGAAIYRVFPYVLTAYHGLQTALPKMATYYARAKSLATALVALPGVHIAPNPPQTNAFQLYLPGEVAALERAAAQIAQEQQIWLFGWFSATAVPGLSMAEVSLGDAIEALSDAEIVATVEQLCRNT